MKLLLALLISLTPIFVNASPMQNVDDYVAMKMADHLIPGLALVVIREGVVVHRRGFGELDPTQAIIIGSLSKSFTSMAVMTLVEDGKVELDAPVQNYLPGMHFDDPRMRAVTVRHLLNQTSGLPARAPRADSRDASLAAHAEALKAVQLVAPPGERHIYSSPNYQLLGRMVEVVSGESFGAYVQRRILEPLQMASSSATGAQQAVPGHNLWWGMAGPSTYRWEPGRVPTASMVVSADDLARFVISQLGEGPQVLSAESRALLHKGNGQAEGFSYAMGWRDGTTTGVPSLWHGGALPSYRGAVVMLPQSRSGVIVLTNMSTIFADHTREIAAGVVALLERRPLPSGIRPLRQVYMAVAAGSVLLVGFALFGLVRALRKPGGKRWKIVAFDLLLPATAVIATPRLLGLTYRDLWESAPDITLTVAVAILLGMVAAALRLFRKRREPSTLTNPDAGFPVSD